jgi:hypothetical protein
MPWLLDFPFGLNRNKPLATIGGYRDLLHHSLRVPAVAVAQPAQPGQEDAAVALIELYLLRVGIAETIAHALLLKPREVRPFGEEVGVGPLQVLECLLQWMRWRILEPRSF